VGYSVGEEAHLGVAALLAGVAAEGVWQKDYLPECFQDVTIRLIVAHWALDPIVVATRAQLVCFADGADDGVRSGR
jgi:hypothetical protein